MGSLPPHTHHRVWTALANPVAESDDSAMAPLLADSASMQTPVKTGVLVCSRIMVLTLPHSLRVRPRSRSRRVSGAPQTRVRNNAASSHPCSVAQIKSSTWRVQCRYYASETRELNPPCAEPTIFCVDHSEQPCYRLSFLWPECIRLGHRIYPYTCAEDVAKPLPAIPGTAGSSSI